MEQQDLNSEQEEIVPQDQEEAAHVEVDQEAKAPQAKAPSPPREQFKRLEQSKRELERELSFQREVNERLLKQSQRQPEPIPEVDEFDAIADDDFIPKGKVKAMIRKEAMKIASDVSQEQHKQFLQQQHQATFMTRLKGQYSDFDEVVNPDTLALLEQNNPELALTIVESKDPYKIGLQSYNYIKAMGLHKSLDSPKSKEVEKKLAANSKTVQSPQAFSKRPMAQAFNGDSEQERKALFDEMNGAARKANFRY